MYKRRGYLIFEPQHSMVLFILNYRSSKKNVVRPEFVLTTDYYFTSISVYVCQQSKRGKFREVIVKRTDVISLLMFYKSLITEVNNPVYFCKIRF